MLTEEDIKEINSNCPENQGVFFEPNGIPYKIKDKVVYMRWEVGGTAGGGCWEHCRQYNYQNDRPSFVALDLVLKKLTSKEYWDFNERERKLIDRLIIEGDRNTENEDYYFNCEEWQVEFIILPVLEALIKTF